MYATKEAIIAKEHAKSLEPTIFYMDIRAHGKDFDRFVNRAKEEYGVRYIRSMPSTVKELQQTKNLLLKYVREDGSLIEEEFDMVVLSVGLTPPKEAALLATNLGIELEEHGFCKTLRENPVRTSREGVFVCGAFGGPKDIPETVMEASGAAACAEGILASRRGTLTTAEELPMESDLRGVGPRTGVFVCHCGINIGGVVDVPSVVEYAKTLPHVVYATDNLFTCSQDTAVKMGEIIREHRLSRVVVASCSPRTRSPSAPGPWPSTGSTTSSGSSGGTSGRGSAASPSSPGQFLSYHFPGAGPLPRPGLLCQQWGTRRAPQAAPA